MSKSAEKLPIHMWTNGSDEVLVLRFSNPDGTAHGGFQHPMNVGESVIAPDWNVTPSCGGGIHGWPWGIGLGEGKNPIWSTKQSLWQVYGVNPNDGIVYIDGKVKFKTGVLRYVGDWHGAMLKILSGQMAWVAYKAKGSPASNSGTRGAASNSGYGGAASNSGYGGAASNSGYGGAASNSGDYGAAVCTGEDSSSETMHVGTLAACTNVGGKVKAEEFGCVALAWKNPKKDRIEMRCATVGKRAGQLKPNTWYRLNEQGKFVQVR